jgi:hypothetical protein
VRENESNGELLEAFESQIQRLGKPATAFTNTFSPPTTFFLLSLLLLTPPLLFLLALFSPPPFLLLLFLLLFLWPSTKSLVFEDRTNSPRTSTVFYGKVCYYSLLYLANLLALSLFRACVVCVLSRSLSLAVCVCVMCYV